MLDGNPIVLDLPSLSDTMANAVSKTATALSTLATGLTPKVTPTQLDINTAVSMAGNALTNVGSVQLAEGNTPTAVGSMYFLNGELFVVDATSAIQVTSNGVLNVAGSVGIVGDYGGTNPARVTYVDTSGQYQFTQDTSIWADVVCRDVILEGTLGNVSIGVDASLAGGKTINVKSLNASNTALLCYKASSSTLEDSATNTDDKQITGNVVITSGALTASGNVKGSQFLHTGLKSATFPVYGGPGSTVNASTNISAVQATAASWSWTSGPFPCIAGDVPFAVFVNHSLVTGQSYAFTLYKYSSIGTQSVLDTWTSTGSGPGGSTSRNIPAYTVVAGDILMLGVIAPAGAAAGDKLTNPRMSYSHPV